jgi:hypothetical protein
VQFSLAYGEKPYFVYELAHEIFVELYSLKSFRVHHYTYHSIIGLLVIGLLRDVRELVVTSRSRRATEEEERACKPPLFSHFRR